MNKTTSGQNVPKALDGRVLEPSGLFLMDGIEGLRSLPRHSVDMLLTDPHMARPGTIGMYRCR